MEENMIFYSSITEKRWSSNTRSQTISSDSEDLGLSIDLGPDNHENFEELDLKTENNADNHVDNDDLFISCEETEASINFFIKDKKQVEETHKTTWKPVKKSVKSRKASKQTKIKNLESFGTQKQSSIVAAKVKKSNDTKKTLLPKKCLKCDFETDFLRVLHEHMKICNRTKYFNCPQCPFYAKSIVLLRKHAEYHSVKYATFRCSKCSFGANSISILGQHLKLHSDDEKIENMFQCPVCPYAASFWKTLSHFKLHAKEHQDLKNIIECPLCNMRTKRSNFGRHSKRHIIPKLGAKTKRKNYGASSLPQQDKKDENDMGSGDNVDNGNIDVTVVCNNN